MYFLLAVTVTVQAYIQPYKQILWNVLELVLSVNVMLLLLIRNTSSIEAALQVNRYSINFHLLLSLFISLAIYFYFTHSLNLLPTFPLTLSLTHPLTPILPYLFFSLSAQSLIPDLPSSGRRAADQWTGRRVQQVWRWGGGSYTICGVVNCSLLPSSAAVCGGGPALVDKPSVIRLMTLLSS